MNGGTVPVPAGTDQFTVTERNFDSVPTSIVVTVRKPDADGFQICASVIDGTMTTDGFEVALSGAADRDGYKLTYFASFFVETFRLRLAGSSGDILLSGGGGTDYLVLAGH